MIFLDGASYEEVDGIAWCPIHHGLINEDSTDCDMSNLEEEGEEQECSPVALFVVTGPSPSMK